MAVNHALQILCDVAREKVREFPVTRQIAIYQALGESLEDIAARANAKELALSLSRTAALQMEFHGL